MAKAFVLKELAGVHSIYNTIKGPEEITLGGFHILCRQRRGREGFYKCLHKYISFIKENFYGEGGRGQKIPKFRLRRM